MHRSHTTGSPATCGIELEEISNFSLTSSERRILKQDCLRRRRHSQGTHRVRQAAGTRRAQTSALFALVPGAATRTFRPYTIADHRRPTRRVNINGDLELYAHGTEKKQKNKTSFYHFLSTIPMASPTLSQALSSPLWPRHTPHIRS